MKSLSFSAGVAALTSLAHAFPQPPNNFVNNATIFEAPASWPDRSTSYGRATQLRQSCSSNHGVPPLLATWAGSEPGGPYFQIMESDNAGKTWYEISKAYFTHGNATGGSFAGGIILQPFLYELEQDIGGWETGDVLLTGNAIPEGAASTNIQLYGSKDKGHSWSYISTVATGGPPNTTNGAPCIWEPFILIHDNQLAVYYSDQRDPLHGQKLAHQISTDLTSWGPVVNDVAYANFTLRPGMITMAQIGDGQWMCSFELGFAPESPFLAPYAVHYKIAASPFEFDASPPMLLQAANTGTIPSSGPYTVWTPAGDEKNGTIVVSDSSYSQLFINTQNGDPSAWEEVPTTHGVGYTRYLTVMPGQGEKTVLLINGGMYNTTVTEVTAGDFIVPGLPGKANDGACNGGSGGWGGKPGNHGW